MSHRRSNSLPFDFTGQVGIGRQMYPTPRGESKRIVTTLRRMARRWYRLNEECHRPGSSCCSWPVYLGKMAAYSGLRGSRSSGAEITSEGETALAPYRSDSKSVDTSAV